MSTATSGRAREHRVRDYLHLHGYQYVMRAAGSKGAGDLLHGHPTYGALLVQVGTGNKTLGPAARDRFCHMADLICATPILATVIHQPGYRTVYRFWIVTRNPPHTWDEWHP